MAAKFSVGSIYYAACTVELLGVDMPCPLCQVMVYSGQKHACSLEEGRIGKKKARKHERKKTK